MCKSGQEVSILALTDGRTIVSLPPSQDHKRVFDNDEGPNTVGMGAYAPVPVMNTTLLQEVHSEILEPTIAALSSAALRGVDVRDRPQLLKP